MIRPISDIQLAFWDSIVYMLGPELEECEAGVKWEDVKLGARHPMSFERMAIVTEARWAQPATKAFSVLWPAFPLAELEAAKHWAAARSAFLEQGPNHSPCAPCKNADCESGMPPRQRGGTSVHLGLDLAAVDRGAGSRCVRRVHRVECGFRRRHVVRRLEVLDHDCGALVSVMENLDSLGGNVHGRSLPGLGQALGHVIGIDVREPDYACVHGSPLARGRREPYIVIVRCRERRS
jgi:hypothetical protein